jgi:hypothetical protein
MDNIQDDWKISPIEGKVSFERYFDLETIGAAADFVESTGDYMSSPHMAVWIKQIEGTNKAMATIQTSDDPVTLVSAGMIMSELDALHKKHIAEPELASV